MLDPLGSAQAVSAVGVRLVFELSQDTPYDLTGELTMFAIGAVASDVRVSLSAAGGGAPWFEQTLAGAFHTRGVLEEGTWVLEISADAYADPSIDPLESSNAVATFRGVHFVLVPAPGPVALLALAGAWAHRRRRDRGVVCSGRGPADPPHLDEAHPGRVPGEHRPLL